MTLPLFADPRRDAIDILHSATAIYTKAAVVDDLLDYLDWPRGDRRLVDPSCGDGAFLERALRRLLVTVGHTDEEILNLLEGWEIHPHAAAEARHLVADVLIEHGRSLSTARQVATAMVRNADFLTEGPNQPKYDCIAGNPPYLIWMRVPSLLREEYDLVVPDYARGDMLYSFLDRGARCLNPGGEIAFVSADRWLFNKTAASLRREIGHLGLSVHHLSRLETSCFCRPKNRVRDALPRVHPVSVVLRFDDGGLTLDGTAIYPDDMVSSCGGGRTLSTIANVRIGPWLGADGVFVIDAATARKLPPEMIVPAIDAKDLGAGTVTHPSKFAILTQPGEIPPEVVCAHLDANMHLMPPRGQPRPGKFRWCPPERFHNLDLTQPSLVVPRIAKSLKPQRLAPGILPLNHNLSIVSAGTAGLDEIERILCSEEANGWVRARAPRLENGYHSLTPTLLRELPVPD
jgi:hypothetical protein